MFLNFLSFINFKSGFIEYTANLGNNNNETRKIFFHVSDLIESNNESSTGTPSSSSNGLKVGDEVEFVVSHGSRNGKQAAIKIKKTRSVSPSRSNTAVSGSATTATTTASGQPSSSSSSTSESASQDASGSDAGAAAAASKRPERLNTRIKIANIDDESGKQLILARQPVNPDAKMSTASFSRERRARMPGICLEP